MDQQTIDNLTASRIIHLLITPYSEWEAHKSGLINKDGKQIADVSFKDSSKFNLLHKLVIRLRELYHITPGSNKIVQPWNAGKYFTGKDLPAGNFTSWSIANKHLLPSAAAAFNVVKEAAKNSYVVRASDKDLLSLLDHVTINDIALFEETAVGGGAFVDGGIGQGAGVVVSRKAAKRYKKGNGDNASTDKAVS